MEIPTIKIRKDNERGWSLINRADFDPSVHQEFGAAPIAPLTRDGVEAMSKDDLAELIRAHGGKADMRKGLPALREQAISTVFVDL